MEMKRIGEAAVILEEMLEIYMQYNFYKFSLQCLYNINVYKISDSNFRFQKMFNLY